MARPRKFADGGVGEGEDFTPDSWYGDAGGISTNEEPQLQRPASETARERLNPAPSPPPAATPAPAGQNLLRFDPAAPPQNLLQFNPSSATPAPAAAPKPAAPAETPDQKFRRQQLESWHHLWKQEGEDIFNPDQKPLLDYVSEVGQGNVGTWHTTPGQSDLTPPSNAPGAYSIGFDPASGERLYSKGQDWFYTKSREPYSGNAVLNKTSIAPQGPAPTDEESTVQQSYPQTTPPAAPPPTTPKTSFVPPGAGTIDASPLLGMIDAAANKWGVPRDLLYGHMMAESRGNPNAVSPAGAQGIMQIMPQTAASLGVNPFNPVQAINGAAHYLAQQYKRFRDWDKASMAYNAGPGNIAKGVVPQETRNYLPIVKKFAAKSPFLHKVGKGLSSMGSTTQNETPQAQPPELQRAPTAPTEPINQKEHEGTLQKLLGMTDLGWAKGGEVHEDAAQDREQTLGILREKKLIRKKGGRAEFAKGGLPDAPEPPKKIPGKDVLHRAPLGHALVPVLHTTIVIGVTPKKGKGKKAEKKADGGRIETAPNFPDTPPRRPRAIPPRRGKTPRGVGKALRGWGKTGR